MRLYNQLIFVIFIITTVVVALELKFKCFEHFIRYTLRYLKCLGFDGNNIKINIKEGRHECNSSGSYEIEIVGPL